MKIMLINKYFAWLLLVMIYSSGWAQEIETDIFNNLKYKSGYNGYEAYLKEDIFTNLIFSDNNENEVTFTKKYLHLLHADELNDAGRKDDFFRELIYKCQKHEQYEATYSVDILGKVVIEEHRSAFDNEGNTKSIKKDIIGTYDYEANNGSATLKEDIFNSWVYEDSNGNAFKFSAETWRQLTQRHGSAENVLLFLTEEFFL
jgi:hypothetical protein